MEFVQRDYVRVRACLAGVNSQSLERVAHKSCRFCGVCNCSGFYDALFGVHELLC